MSVTASSASPADENMAATHLPRRVAVIGTGTIGLSWMRLFAAYGSHVVVFDPRPDIGEAVALVLEEAEIGEDRVSIADSPAAAADGVAFVQENGPENPEAKAALFADLANAAAEDALLASSSSAILPTQISRELDDQQAARMIVGHPFNPPHIMPLVEVVPGERTTADTIDRAMSVYSAYGRSPVRLNRETRAFVGNRLQNAVLREAVHLVQAGIIDPAGLDAVMKSSLGLRWTAVGPFEGMHLGGGKHGFRGFMKHIGPSFAAIDLHEPDLTDPGMEPVIAQVEEQYGSAPDPALANRRDYMQQAILRLRSRPHDSGR